MSRILKLTLWQSIFLLVLAGCLSVPVFSYFIKVFIDIFSSGRSNFKIIFFFCFIMVVLAFRYFKPLQSRPATPSIALWLCASIYFLGVYEYFSFTDMFDFPPQGTFQIIWDGALSATHFDHSHNAKVVMAWLLQWLPHVDLKNYDFGSPYLTLYPNWLLALQSSLYVIFFILTLYQLRDYSRLPLGWYAVFVMSCFIILRNELDGGVFFRESLAALPIYIAVQLSFLQPAEKQEKLVIRWKYIVISFICTAAVLFYFYHIRKRWVTDSPTPFIILCIFLYVIYAAFDAVEKGKWSRGIIMAAGFAGVFWLTACLGIYKSWGMLQFEFMNQKIEGTFNALVPKKSLNTVMHNGDFDIANIVEISDLEIITARPKRPLSVWQLGQKWNYVVNYPAVDRYNTGDCDPTEGYSIEGNIYVVQSSQNIARLSKTYGANIVFNLMPLETDKAAGKYELRLSVPGCIPDIRELVKAITKDVGIRESALQIHMQNED